MEATMPVAANTARFLELLRKSGLLPEGSAPLLSAGPEEPAELAHRLVAQGLLTRFQANQLLAGRHRDFFLGSYRILELLGQGGMGKVFLAEHTTLRRRAALKVLAPEVAQDPLSLQRFLREGRAAAALNHPNIVRVLDVCQQGKV